MICTLLHLMANREAFPPAAVVLTVSVLSYRNLSIGSWRDKAGRMGPDLRHAVAATNDLISSSATIPSIEAPISDNACSRETDWIRCSGKLVLSLRVCNSDGEKSAAITAEPAIRAFMHSFLLRKAQEQACVDHRLKNYSAIHLQRFSLF